MCWDVTSHLVASWSSRLVLMSSCVGWSFIVWVCRTGDGTVNQGALYWQSLQVIYHLTVWGPRRSVVIWHGTTVEDLAHKHTGTHNPLKTDELVGDQRSSLDRCRGQVPVIKSLVSRSSLSATGSWWERWVERISRHEVTYPVKHCNMCRRQLVIICCDDSSWWHFSNYVAWRWYITEPWRFISCHTYQSVHWVIVSDSVTTAGAVRHSSSFR